MTNPDNVGGLLLRALGCLELLDNRPRPQCRDCADNDGVCPSSGLDCDMRALVVGARRELGELCRAAPAGGECQHEWAEDGDATAGRLFCRLCKVDKPDGAPAGGDIERDADYYSAGYANGYKHAAKDAAPAGGDVCKTCQGHGMIGWTTGQTPEQFDQHEAPCPDCSAPAGSGEVGRQAEWLEGMAKHWDASIAISAMDADRLADIAALLRKLQQGADGWRPIESAPKDEPILIGPTKRLGICVAMHHSRDGWVTETPSEWVPIYQPSCWQPIPRASQDQEGNGNV